MCGEFVDLVVTRTQAITQRTLQDGHGITDADRQFFGVRDSSMMKARSRKNVKLLRSPMTTSLN
jgi:hypothetical protein